MAFFHTNYIKYILQSITNRWITGEKIMAKKIMVVDDDADILITIRKIFEAEGFEVLTVDSGKDCIIELEKGFKGVILMDIMMPFMDGWDTISEIKKRGLNNDIVISIITAKGTPDTDKIKGLQPNIYDYITKPFDVKKLLSNVEKMITF